MNTHSFCYWLQGFFEISINPQLRLKEIHKIQRCLNTVSESSPFIAWIKNAIQVIEINGYHQPIIAFYSKAIQQELNRLFLHVIDTSYETEYTQEALGKTHRGE